MNNGVTVFVCGQPKEMCSTTECRTPARKRCTYKLGGKKQGQTCNRNICDGCAGTDTLCPSHRRMLERQQAR